MAYPGGGVNNDARVAKIIQNHTNIRYARALETTQSLTPSQDLYRFRGTVYHHEEWEMMHELADQFLTAEPDEPMLLYIWGHSYEFDIYPERWSLFESFCKRIAGKADVFYGTNREVLLNSENMLK